MRPIQSLTLKNFRGYFKEHTIDLDADLVLVTGKNGSGKTSLLFAIDLLLNGRTSLIANSGKLLSTDTQEGFVQIAGPNQLREDLAAPTDGRAYANLLERAQFFFPEGLATPENSQDILSILSPTANAWEAIRVALGEAQAELAAAKSSILVQEFDVERERKTLAQQFDAAQGQFSIDSIRDARPASVVLEARSLLLQNGNLANRWQSQLRNLLEKLAEAGGVPYSSSIEPAAILDSIADVCDKLQASAGLKEKPNSAPPTDFQVLQRVLQGVSPERELPWERLLQSDAAHEVAALQLARETLSRKKKALADIQEMRRQLETDEQGLLASLTNLAARSETWLANLQALPGALRRSSVELESWVDRCVNVGPVLTMQAEVIAESLRQSELELLSDIASIETQVGELTEVQQLRDAVLPFTNNNYITGATTVRALLDRIEDRRAELGQQRNAYDEEVRAFRALSAAARAWANLEREILRQETLSGRGTGKTEAEKLLTDAERTLRRALGKDSPFSLTTAIDESQLRELTKTLNQLLARFHFPPDFLPMELQVVSRNTKAPTYRFASARGPDYAGLSTGQKTQLAVCWSVCLNYSLSDRLTHKVMAFDDFTTALDMGQLIPAAGILRQLAYCERDDARRQVIVTSHHEDLTNRLLDYLLPPAGRSMKVIEFREWTPGHGPEWEVYDVKSGASSGSGSELGAWLNAQLGSRLG